LGSKLDMDWGIAALQLTYATAYSLLIAFGK